MPTNEDVQEQNGNKPHPREVHKARQEGETSKNKRLDGVGEIDISRGYGEDPDIAEAKEERRRKEAQTNTPS